MLMLCPGIPREHLGCFNVIVPPEPGVGQGTLPIWDRANWS